PPSTLGPSPRHAWRSRYLPQARRPPDHRSFPTRRSSDLLVRDRATADSLARRVVSEEASREMRYLFRLNVEKGSGGRAEVPGYLDRKSTRLNSTHVKSSYAVVLLEKKT